LDCFIAHTNRCGKRDPSVVDRLIRSIAAAGMMRSAAGMTEVVPRESAALDDVGLNALYPQASEIRVARAI
jgi:hypothetical protein